MKTDEKITSIEQTVIERDIFQEAFNDISNSEINIWKDIISKELHPLEYWLSNGWRIIDISTSTSVSLPAGGIIRKAIHTMIVLERKN